jgi:FAD/FMN-containing dehydrogenase
MTYEVHDARNEASDLQTAIAGRVHAAGDAGYDAARRPWQRKFDPHPALVVEATSAADVQAALRFARERGLPFSVQGVGHGIVRPLDGGVLVKLTAMDGVEVSAGARTVRAQGGAVWSDVIAAAAPHGLAPLSGTSPAVSVAGYTVGGGAGWLSRAYGYAADSVLRAEVVTAEGELVTASPEEHPDLFWALRGGSGNFGVVTALEFRLYPVASVYAGMAMFDAERAGDVFATYRDWALDELDESNTAVAVAQLPPIPELPEPVRGRRVVMLRAMYAGDPADAERLLAPLYDAAGPPLLNGMRATTYADAAAMLPSPPPSVAEMRLELFHELPDEVIAAAVNADGAVSGVELRHWGGAMARPPEGAGPIGHRDVPFSVVVSAQSPDPEQAEGLDAAVEAVVARLRPHATGGSFLNFLGDPARTASAYAPDDYRRLGAVKAAYDPDNVFQANHNIPPERG